MAWPTAACTVGSSKGPLAVRRPPPWYGGRQRLAAHEAGERVVAAVARVHVDDQEPGEAGEDGGAAGGPAVPPFKEQGGVRQPLAQVELGAELRVDRPGLPAGTVAKAVQLLPRHQRLAGRRVDGDRVQAVGEQRMNLRCDGAGEGWGGFPPYPYVRART